jgi:F-type H+-transporting ATPase subunit a
MTVFYKQEILNFIKLYNCVLGEFNPIEPVLPVPLFTFSAGGYKIVVSNHMFIITLATVVLLLLLSVAMRSPRLIPKGLQNLIELICVYLREQMARPVLGEYTDQFICFIWTIFFFILTLNLLAMVPLDMIIYLITGRHNHLAGAATANIWITGGLAIVSFFVIHIAGIKKQGLWHYIVNFAPKAPWPMVPIVYSLEIISAFVRPFALAIRLFANMLAGHTILAAFLGLILVFKNYGVAFASITATVAMSFLELLIAFIQAYVFTFLSTVFISFSISQEH